MKFKKSMSRIETNQISSLALDLKRKSSEIKFVSFCVRFETHFNIIIWGRLAFPQASFEFSLTNSVSSFVHHFSYFYLKTQFTFESNFLFSFPPFPFSLPFSDRHYSSKLLFKTSSLRV